MAALVSVWACFGLVLAVAVLLSVGVAGGVGVELGVNCRVGVGVAPQVGRAVVVAIFVRLLILGRSVRVAAGVVLAAVRVAVCFGLAAPPVGAVRAALVTVGDVGVVASRVVRRIGIDVVGVCGAEALVSLNLILSPPASEPPLSHSAATVAHRLPASQDRAH